MANYLFLRGNRNKRFFLDAAKELTLKGHQTFQLKFELGELLIKNDLPSIFVPSMITSEKYPISDQDLLNLPIYNITYKKRMLDKETSEKELQVYKRYMYFIDRFIAEKKIDTVCLFNGYHWLDQITKVIASKRGLDIFYFEDGLFRPFTITCDNAGINADASIPKSGEFYDRLEIDSTRLKSYLHKPESPALQMNFKENLFKVAAVKAVSMIGSLCCVHPRFYDHITFGQAAKYFIYKKGFQIKKTESFSLPEEYIFLPFQVSRDTQIFYNSPNIATMEELFEHVLSAVKKINEDHGRKIKLVVKEHPEDLSRNNYRGLKNKYRHAEEVTFLKKYDTAELIEKSLAVVTINSTVGVEAIAKKKTVVTLGEAFYNIDGIAHHCRNPRKLDQQLLTALHTKPNKKRMEKFIYYLRFCYQIEGSINHSNKQTAVNVAGRISSAAGTLKEYIK